MRRDRASRRGRRERPKDRRKLRYALFRGIVQGEYQHRGGFPYSSQKNTGTTGPPGKTYSR